MAKEAVEAVIGKILLDAEFRLSLLADPDQALAGFDLTQGEKARLKNMDSETLESLAKTLEVRIRKKRLAA
jgi:hypothetical protein